MPYRRRGFLWPMMLLVIAAAALAWLLHPLPARHHARRPVRVAATFPSYAPTATPVAAMTPLSPSPQPSAPTVSPAASGARLAIVIDDAGQWLDTERALIALPIPLTLSVLPDVPYARLIADEASAAGKGVMLHLPMEPVSEINPGPGKVTTEMTDAQIVAQVNADVAAVPLAQGVNNHEGSKATADERVMRDVATAIAQRRNLFFIDSLTTPDSVAAAAARAAGIPTATRDVFLDNQADVAYVEAQLRAAATVALERGHAIAIGHPRPTTLEALRAMIPVLQGEGIRFVLVRDLVEP